jgi:hypothetical protein
LQRREWQNAAARDLFIFLIWELEARSTQRRGSSLFSFSVLSLSARIHNTMTELLERGGERNARYKMRMYKLEGRRAIN